MTLSCATHCPGSAAPYQPRPSAPRPHSIVLFGPKSRAGRPFSRRPRRRMRVTRATPERRADLVYGNSPASEGMRFLESEHREMISPASRRPRCSGRIRTSPKSSLLICPSGGLLTGVSSPFCKNISVFTYPKSHLQLFASHPTRGAYHDRHGRGVGCGGRGSVLRAMGSQGGFFESVSGQQHADERCCCVRRNRVVLTPRRWRQVRGVASALPGLDKTLIRK